MNKKNYIVKKIESLGRLSKNIWDEIEQINIDSFLWDNNGYKPKSFAKLFYTDSHFHIYFKSYEDTITINYFNMNEDVYKDSCVEFFVKPDPLHDDRYFNFEMNSIGTLLLGLGPDRYNRNKLTLDKPSEFFNVSSSVDRDGIDIYNNSSICFRSKNKPSDQAGSIAKLSDKFWTVQYSIPFSFIKDYFGEINFSSGHRLEANFYKCGDESEYPHYGSWNPIEIAEADFHRPEYFGGLLLD